VREHEWTATPQVSGEPCGQGQVDEDLEQEEVGLIVLTVEQRRDEVEDGEPVPRREAHADREGADGNGGGELLRSIERDVPEMKPDCEEDEQPLTADEHDRIERDLPVMTPRGAGTRYPSHASVTLARAGRVQRSARSPALAPPSPDSPEDAHARLPRVTARVC
jgi:hypothetical protein